MQQLAKLSPLVTVSKSKELSYSSDMYPILTSQIKGFTTATHNRYFVLFIETSLLIILLGWVSTILYLAANALVSMKKVEVDSAIYQGMNIVAGALVVNQQRTCR